MSIKTIIKHVLYTPWLLLLLNGTIATALEDHAPEGTTTKLVIQISEDDPAKQHLALSNVYNLQKFYGMDNIEIEVVAYGPGITLLDPNNKEAIRVRSLMAQDVIFNCMSKYARYHKSQYWQRTKAY